MKRVAIALILTGGVAVATLHGCTDARGQIVTDTLTWVMPIARTDGAVLPISEIAKTTIAWGTVPGGPYPNFQDVPSPTTRFVFTRGVPATGARCYTAFVTDTQGNVGGSTPELCKTVVTAPRSPTNLGVT